MDTPESIAESSYEGWVAWVGGTAIRNPATMGLVGWENCSPIFEAVEHNPGLAQIIGGLRDRLPMPRTRRSMDWKELPHEEVKILQLYAFRQTYGNEQPLLTLVRNVDRDTRWIQTKSRGLVLPSTHIAKGDARESGGVTGQARTGIISWRLGYWDRTIGQCEMVEYFADGREPQKWEFQGKGHPWGGVSNPCWPRPLGFALAPHVLGLSDEDVPPVPSGFEVGV